MRGELELLVFVFVSFVILKIIRTVVNDLVEMIVESCE
jgi:hypothetical protein